MKKQKEFSKILAIFIFLLVIGAGISLYIINKNQIDSLNFLGCELDYECDNPNSLQGFKLARCEIKNNSQISKVSSIRIQNIFNNEWNYNNPSLKEISQEVVCDKNPENFRIFFIGVMRKHASASGNWSKQDLLDEEDSLLSLVTNDSESIEFRSEIMIELPKVYYYLNFSGEEAKNIFDVAEYLLDQKNELATIAKLALSGPLADIDPERSKKILEADF